MVLFNPPYLALLFALLPSACSAPASGETGVAVHVDTEPPATPAAETDVAAPAVEERPFVPASFHCPVDDEAVRLAGPGAEPCGELALREPGEAWQRCLEQGLRTRRAVWGTREIQGIDAMALTAFAFDGEDGYRLFRATESSWVEVWSCPDLVLVSGEVRCRGSKRRRKRTCKTIIWRPKPYHRWGGRPPERAPCQIDDEAKRLAGPSARWCGHRHLRGEDADWEQCMERAFREGQPSWGTWQVQGVDSEVIRAFAFDGVSTFRLSRDGDPSGGGGAHPTLDVERCDVLAYASGDAACEGRTRRLRVCG